jgi:hypothetical protein
MVVYIGSLSKALAPAIRVGYVAGPVELIEELGRLRRIIDRQGDPVLEQAVAELFREGEISRHLKKALKAYHQRRDHCCALLRENWDTPFSSAFPTGAWPCGRGSTRRFRCRPWRRRPGGKGCTCPTAASTIPGAGPQRHPPGICRHEPLRNERAIEVLSAALG